MRKLLLPICCLIILSCTVTSNVSKELSVTENRFIQKVDFSPKTIVKEIPSGLTVEIHPISQDSINIYIDQVKDLQGIYNFSYSMNKSDLVTKISENDNGNTKKDKIISLIINECEKYDKSTEYTKRVVNQIFYGMNNQDKLKKSEIYSTFTINPLNPYNIESIPLSLFEIRLTNKTNNLINFSINDITLYFNDEVFIPLKTDFIEKYNLTISNKLFLERTNLTEEIIIHGKQSVKRLFSTLPTCNKTDNLKIFVNDVLFSFLVDHNIELITETITSKFITVNTEDIRSSSFNFVVINTEDNSFYKTKNNTFLLRSDSKEENIDLIVYNFHSGKFYIKMYRNVEMINDKIIIDNISKTNYNLLEFKSK